MADHTQDKTNNVVGGVKSALKGIKGTGDAIRGTFNESVDAAFNDQEGEVKNRTVREKGEAKMRDADQTLAGTKTRGGATTTTTGLRTGGLGGTTSSSTATAAPATTATATTKHGTTTDAGAHSGGVGNLSSGVVPPEHGLGGEPAPARERERY
ncbi:hypothetical protein RBB50_012345 [Rhinocladiella similis]